MSSSEEVEDYRRRLIANDATLTKIDFDQVHISHEHLNILADALG